MTITELYEWAMLNNCENLDIEIQYRDGGGDYSGTDDDLYLVVDDKSSDYPKHTDKVVIL